VPEACEKDPHKRHVKPERQKWFGCACCPPNLIRMLASLEDYVAMDDGDTLWLNLYVGGRISAGGLALSVETRYPWEGLVRLTVEADSQSRIALRIPGWCRKWSLAVNGSPLELSPKDGYALIERCWQKGDVIELSLDMPARYVRANPRLREDAGKVALQRGPVVYCLEEADNGAALHGVRVGNTAEGVEPRWEPDTLGGVVTLASDGLREEQDGWGETLYDFRDAPASTPVRLRWIPYYAWANRGVGEMRVWVRS